MAALKESEIGLWLDSLRHELVAPLSQEFARDRPRKVLFLARDHKHYIFFQKATRLLFLQYVEQAEQLGIDPEQSTPGVALPGQR